MTRSLSAIPEERRAIVARRRLENGTRTGQYGNGFWGAKDFLESIGESLPVRVDADYRNTNAKEHKANGQRNHKGNNQTGKGIRPKSGPRGYNPKASGGGQAPYKRKNVVNGSNAGSTYRPSDRHRVFGAPRTSSFRNGTALAEAR